MAIEIKKKTPGGEMNLTPMIDMVFLLLIFFLVASQMAEEEERRLDIKLPHAGTARPLTAQVEKLTIHIARDNRFFVQDRYVDAPELEAVLKQAATDNPDRQQVEIRADRQAVIQSLATVADICNKTGITDYGFVTSVEAPAP